ncbi:MAG: GTP cyclohydrolase FolE2 [Chitinivorax sp.]
MNAPHVFTLPDIQSQADLRQLPIQAVGIKAIRYPLNIRSGAMEHATIADWSLSVALPAEVKGTHMSRFIELLEQPAAALDQAGFIELTRHMLQRLQAISGAIEARFPYFIRKAAPVSGVSSLLDVNVGWRCEISSDGRVSFAQKLQVAATSLCPCSKQISAYGAHNQRSHIRIDATLNAALSIEEQVALAEDNASCQVYGLLKRVDEKHVTERAYDNPKFVEDLVRDVAQALQREPRISRYSIEVENYESIHNHSAFARISSGAEQTSA